MKHLNKLFTGLTIALSVYCLILGGYEMGKHSWGDMVTNLVLGLFWFGFLFILHFESLSDERVKISKRAIEEIKKVIAVAEEAIESVVEKSKQKQNMVHDKELLRAVLKDMGFEGTEVVSEPFEVAKHSRVHIPVKDGNMAIQKPLTKSQQRRTNAKKGLGALTDEEIREARNEKRRAARIAKKAVAESSTTSTTTQPGQISLV